MKLGLKIYLILQILHEITFKCFNKILEITFKDAKKDDRVRIVIKHPNEKDKDKKTELFNNYSSVRRYAGIQKPKIDRLKRAIKHDYGPYGLDVAKQIKNYLKIGISILGDVASFYKFLMKGNSQYEEQINLFSNNNHLDVINSLPSFFSARQYWKYINGMYK